jgi:hypothetical protein
MHPHIEHRKADWLPGRPSNRTLAGCSRMDALVGYWGWGNPLPVPQDFAFLPALAAFLTASRSGHAGSSGFVPGHGRWWWGNLPDEACIFIQSGLVVEVGQDHEPLGRWMCLLPILDDGRNHLFSFLCMRLHLCVCQEGNRTYADYRGNDALYTCPSSGSHAAPDKSKYPTLRRAQGSTFHVLDLQGVAQNRYRKYE